MIEILSSRTKDPAQLEEAVAIMERSGSIDYARDYAEELVNSAKERISTILDPSLSRDLLVSMAIGSLSVSNRSGGKLWIS